MPTLTINGTEVSVPQGATILDAARSLDIDVPTLCWYPKLPIVGNCRICLVSVAGNPKLVPACAMPAEDGQVVTTESVAAVENRKAVLGMLLERYPTSDIPEHEGRNEFEQLVHRYNVPTVRRSDLPFRMGDEREGDPLIQHDMSTCILCTRCVRHAARAENAGGHVMLDERIAFPLVAHAKRQIGAPGRRNLIAMDELFELVAAFVLGDVGGGISLEEHAEDCLAVFHRRDRFGGDDLPILGWYGAGRDEFRITGHGDQADPTVAHDGQLRIPAQGGHVDVERTGGIQNG